MGQRLISGIIYFVLSLAPLGSAQEAVDIRVWLLKGIQMEGEAALEKVEIMSPVSNPELSSLKSLISRSEDDFKEGLIDALMEAKSLRTMDDLWLFKRNWEKSRPSLGSAIIKNRLSFRVDLYRIHLSPTQLAFRAVISKSLEGAVREYKSDRLSAQDAYLATRDESKMEKIVDQELLVMVGEPTVVGVPYKDGVYYMAILATPEAKGFDNPTATKVERSGEAELVEAPQAVQKVLPAFPEELRQKEIPGEVGLLVTIDKKGNVEGVEVRKPFHPYLDFSAVQAVRKWMFEPVLRKDNPIRASFNLTIRFNPQSYTEAAVPSEKVLPGDIQRMIDGCAAYGRELAEMGLFFACEESIKETHYWLKPEISSWEMTSFSYTEKLSETLSMRIGTQIMDPTRTEINRYVCDYQLIKKDGPVEERRMLIKENGQKISGWTKLLEERRFRVLNPFLDFLKIFDHDHRSRFDFRLVGEEKIRGKRAYIIEASPRSDAAGGDRLAKFWVEKETFQLIRSEIRGVPIEGYEDVLTDSAALNTMPEFLTIHEYETENNGILYPERTSVKVEYPRPGRNILKYKSDLTYGKFKFFSVETKHTIIK